MCEVLQLELCEYCRDSNNHRMISEDNFMITTAGSLLSKQHQIRMETRRFELPVMSTLTN